MKRPLANCKDISDTVDADTAALHREIVYIQVDLHGKSWHDSRQNRAKCKYNDVVWWKRNQAPRNRSGSCNSRHFRSNNGE